MKVFIIKDCVAGKKNEMVNVADGYAMNFLIPNSFAIPCTNLNEKEIQNRLKNKEEKTKNDDKKKTALSTQIEKEVISFEVKSHDDGVLYGSISANEISDAITKKGISVSKSQVLLEKPIKKTGTYLVGIKLSNSLKPNIKVKVSAIK